MPARLIRAIDYTSFIVKIVDPLGLWLRLELVIMRKHALTVAPCGSKQMILVVLLLGLL